MAAMSGMPSASPPSESRPDRGPRARTLICAALALAAVQLVAGPKLQLSQWQLTAEKNVGVVEGLAWLDGRIDLPLPVADPLHHRPNDTALIGGRIYNVFPPLFGLLTVTLLPLNRFFFGCDDYWLPILYVAVVFGSLFTAAFLAFRARVADAAWAGLLSVGLVAGSAVLPNLYLARHEFLGGTYHVTATTGLLLLAGDLLGRQRIWPGLIGLLVAFWSRPLTIFFALPLAWVAWRRGRRAMFAVGMALVVLPPAALNYAKFGSPAPTGYRAIYVGREHEPVARRCDEFGLFNPRFAWQAVGDLPHSNLYYMHLALPQINVSSTSIDFVPDWHGVNIWFTTPLLLFVLLDLRRWWAERPARFLMLASLPIMAALLCYHDPGFIQFGYYRYALDFIPVWLLVIAPGTRGGRRAWFASLCIAWSLLYFQSVTPNQPAAHRLTRSMPAKVLIPTTI